MEKESLELCEILMTIQDGITRTEMLLSSGRIGGKTKDFMRSAIYNRLVAARRDIILSVPASDGAVLKSGLLNEESPYQMQNIRFLFMQLNAEQRNHIEDLMIDWTNKAKEINN
jgi:hypothetical protein